MELPNQDKTRTLGKKETYKYLGVLEADTIKQKEEKEKIRKNITRELESNLRTNWIAETLKKVNSWAVPLKRYSWPFLKWTREELM